MKTNIEIPVADLKNVLPGLSKIVSKRTSLPVLGCVKFTLGADRTLRIQANNLDQIVTARLNKPFQGKPGEMLVPLDELASIAKRCAAHDTIELNADDKDQETSITYPAAGTRIKKPLNHVGLEEFPPETVVDTEPVKLDDAFKEALQQAFECASVDQTRYVLQGACLDVSNKEAHYVVGTDGRHLFSANSFLFDVPASINIPPGKFLTWDGFIDDGAWTLRFQPEIKPDTKAKTVGKPASVRLDSEHWTYVSRPIEGDYPNWKQVVPPANALISHITLGEPGIKTILEALPLLPGAEELDQPVTLEIKGEYLTLKAKGKHDWTEIPIPAKVSGKPVAVPMNRKYLAKALKFGCTQIDIEDKVSPLVCSTKGKTMVICPLGDPDAKKAPAASTTPPAPPPENASAAATPPAAEPTQQAQPPTEGNQPPVVGMEGTAAITSGTLNTAPPETEETSAIELMLAQIGNLRNGVKKILEDLGDTERLVRKAQKEHKATEKEIGKARSTLRSLKSLEL